MESVRPTDEVYEGDHMGESFGGWGFHIAACLITPVRPRHRPQDDAFLTPITKKKTPRTAVWTPQLPPKPSHTCSVEGHRPRDTPETENVYACMTV